MAMDYLQHLAVGAGLPKGDCFAIDGWECDRQLDGDDVRLSMAWDIDLCRWQAWVGTEAEPTKLQTSPLFETPQEALAWLKAQSDAYTHIPCEECDDTGLLDINQDCWAYSTGHYTRESCDFCDCKIGQEKRNAAEVY